jgi:hypothetical protein
VTAPNLISRHLSVVNHELTHMLSELLKPLLARAEIGALRPRDAEVNVWEALVALGNAVLTAVLSAICRGETERAAVKDDALRDLRPRMDADYTATIKTTLGPVHFPWFAIRDQAGRTHVPARRLFPLREAARVSELLLEWECQVAADHPFRKAADTLEYFTHGAVDIEDTTIERHALLAGRSISPEWLYRSPQNIRAILRDRATLDIQTGRPFLYVSTDAHALRLFGDETWAADWKMVNGIRVWCKDRKTGATIHIGGEFTAGNCHEVVRRLRARHESGALPFDGDYGDGLVAQIAVLTDGLPWIAEHVLPLYPNALASLDPYHVVEQVAEAARAALPKQRVNALITRARHAVGMRERRGRTYYRKGNRRTRYKTRSSGMAGSGDRLLTEVLEPMLPTLTRGKKRFKQVIRYVRGNLYRMHYGDLRTRGAQIGSGAMESLHRTGSQTRLKRAGCRWRPEAAEAILNLRMLILAERWSEFWNRPETAERIARRSVA